MGPSIKAGRPSKAAQQDEEKQGTALGGGSVDKLRARQLRLALRVSERELAGPMQA